MWESCIRELYDRPNWRENLEVETEEEVEAEEKGPFIMRSEVEKAIKEMRDKKTTRRDVMPGDILKMLGDDGLSIMTQLISNIFETGECPKNFTEVTMIAL